MKTQSTLILPFQRLFLVRGGNEIEAIRETIDLIAQGPADVKLLRKELRELKESLYYFRSVADLRRYLDPKFERSFFSRTNRQFFKDSGYKWDTRSQTLTVIKSTGNAQYQPKVCNGKLELRHV